jgi:hypothetical protein
LIENPLAATAPLSGLSADETAQRERLEKVVKDGWVNFLEVGHALIEIQRENLYRDYGTFEQYCRDRLNISRPYAYSMIGSAEVYDDLSANADIKQKPLNEFQIRSLIPVPKEKRVLAWKEVVRKADGKTITAKLVREVSAPFRTKRTGKKIKAVKKAAVPELNLRPALKLLDAIEKLADKDKIGKLKEKVDELRQWLRDHAGK